jgi:hypothetical protein
MRVIVTMVMGNLLLRWDNGTEATDERLYIHQQLVRIFLLQEAYIRNNLGQTNKTFLFVRERVSDKAIQR